MGQRKQLTRARNGNATRKSRVIHLQPTVRTIGQQQWSGSQRRVLLQDDGVAHGAISQRQGIEVPRQVNG
jgi:hypothetical protein